MKSSVTAVGIVFAVQKRAYAVSVDRGAGPNVGQIISSEAVFGLVHGEGGCAR